MLNSSICIGRDDELNKYGDYISKYNFEQSFVFNLHGAGGIGKTIITNKLYQECHTYIDDNVTDTKAVYINASGCYSIPSILFKLRMELDNTEYDFEKFDTMYELLYDAKGYIKAKDMQELITEAVRNDDKSSEYRLSDEVDEKQKNLAKLIIQPIILDIVKEGISQIVPIIGRVKIFDLIDQIKDVISDEQRRERYIEILRDIDDKKETFKKESLLMEYFKCAIKDNAKLFFFIDNFQNAGEETRGEFRFNNIDRMLKFCKECKVFWFIASRDPLPIGFADVVNELKGLDEEASKRIIESTKGFDQISNYTEIISNILKVSQQGNNEAGDNLYSPIVINLLSLVLENEIKKVSEEKLGVSKLVIPATRFSTIPDELDLAYYFEMGRAIMDLDCFHILSCLNVWDGFSLSILKEKIQLYILNARYLLARDSMTEFVGEDSIKLHEKIAESLRKSATNRIRYDVYAIMYDTFIEIQTKTPISNVNALRNFFELAKEFCNCVKDNNIYKDRNISAFEAYTRFYLSFLKSVHNVRTSNVTEEFLAIYDMVVKEYKEFLDDEKKDEGEIEKVYEAYFELGLLLYDLGDSQWAARIDEEYLEFAKKNKGMYGLAAAQNALAYDLSANHKYIEAYRYGVRSLKAALNGMEEIGKTTGDPKVIRWVEAYKNIINGYKTECNILEAEVVTTRKKLLKDVISGLGIFESQKHNLSFVKLLEILLIARGNLPWYILQNSIYEKDKLKCSIIYGIDTYLMREVYFGKMDRRTLISHHNIGVYLLKYMEACYRGQIQDDTVNTVKGFIKAKEVFDSVLKLRIEKRKIQTKEYDSYLKQLEEYYCKLDEEEIIEEVPRMIDIYSKEYISCILGDISDYDKDSLETLQYKGNACYGIYKCYEKKDDVIDLNIAIDCVEKTAVMRSFILGIHHRKTLESMRYAAEYYWHKGDIENARKRISYAFNHLNKEKTSEALYDEYKALYEKML